MLTTNHSLSILIYVMDVSFHFFCQPYFLLGQSKPLDGDVTFAFPRSVWRFSVCCRKRALLGACETQGKLNIPNYFKTRFITSQTSTILENTRPPFSKKPPNTLPIYFKGGALHELCANCWLWAERKMLKHKVNQISLNNLIPLQNYDIISADCRLLIAGTYVWKCPLLGQRQKMFS